MEQDNNGKQEMTEIERRLAERAEAEFEQIESPAEPEPQPALAFSMFDERWEPPQRPLYDYEVVALVNRDCMRYAATGLMLDSVEDVDAYASRQLDEYGDRMTTYQAEYYRITLAELLFKAVLTSIIHAQRRFEQPNYQATYNQIAQEANRPSKRRGN